MSIERMFLAEIKSMGEQRIHPESEGIMVLSASPRRPVILPAGSSLPSLGYQELNLLRVRLGVELWFDLNKTSGREVPLIMNGENEVVGQMARWAMDAGVPLDYIKMIALGKMGEVDTRHNFWHPEVQRYSCLTVVTSAVCGPRVLRTGIAESMLKIQVIGVNEKPIDPVWYRKIRKSELAKTKAYAAKGDIKLVIEEGGNLIGAERSGN